MTISEDLLHYIWKTKAFDLKDLKTTDGRLLQITHFGHHNQNAGPDFLSGRIKIDSIEWAGHIELHVFSSDWIAHKHQEDIAYANTILHVVLHNDIQIKYPDNTAMPTLELHGRIQEKSLVNYNRLFQRAQWIPCERLIRDVSSMNKTEMTQQALIDRMIEKSDGLLKELNSLNGHWHELIYRRIAWSLGLSVNGDALLELATRTPYSIVQKHRDNLIQLEALMFGQSGLLMTEKEDAHLTLLKGEYGFLQQKYQLNPMNAGQWKFSKMLPAGFPTIRIAQFANLLHQYNHLDQLLFETDTLSLQKTFEINTSDYWLYHYRFGTETARRPKVLGRQKINIILINAAAPLLFAYGSYHNESGWKEKAVDLLCNIPSEKNAIIDKWKTLGMPSDNAADSQGLLALKKSYCAQSRCLHCRIGHSIMNESSIQ